MATYGDLQFATTSKTQTVKGLQFPVKTSNTGGMFGRNFNEEAIKDGLIQLIMTQRGERPMRLDYGTDLRSSVFGALDAKTVSNLRTTILAAIERYEPRVIVRSFEIIPDDANSSISMKLAFSIRDNVFYTDQIYLTVDSKGVTING